MTIGEKIKEIRLSKGLTMVQAADRAGTTKQKIWQLEHGSIEYPTIPVLEQVAKGLDCTVVDLIAEPLGIKVPTCICINADKCPFFKRRGRP